MEVIESFVYLIIRSLSTCDLLDSFLEVLSADHVVTRNAGDLQCIFDMLVLFDDSP